MTLPQASKGVNLIVFLSLILSPLFIQAQDDSKIQIGAKIAGSYNDVYAKDTKYYATSPLVGGSVGVYGTYKVIPSILPKLKVQLEVLLTTRGVKMSKTSLASSASPFDSYDWLGTTAQSYAGVTYYSVQKQAFYLDIPLGLTYEVYPNITVEAGGMVSIYLDEHQNRIKNGYTVDFTAPDDIKYEQNMFFSVYGGAAYKFNFGLNVGGRYNLGLSPLFQDIKRGERGGRELMPYSFQLYASYPIFKF
jgi:hypothetical protein